MKIIHISEKSLTKLQLRYGWHGTGIKEDPIIIDSIEKIRLILKFKNINSHILVKDITVYDVRIVKSRNITIENCKVFQIDIEASYNLTIKKSSIINGKLRYCRESLFENNIFHKTSAAVDLSEKGSNRGDRLMRVVQRGALIGSFLLLILMNIALFSLNALILSLFVYVIPLIFFLGIQMKKKFIKGFERNKFINNWYGDLEDIAFLFSKT
jgi:hypothetical protein